MLCGRGWWVASAAVHMCRVSVCPFVSCFVPPDEIFYPLWPTPSGLKPRRTLVTRAWSRLAMGSATLCVCV